MEEKRVTVRAVRRPRNDIVEGRECGGMGNEESESNIPGVLWSQSPHPAATVLPNNVTVRRRRGRASKSEPRIGGHSNNLAGRGFRNMEAVKMVSCPLLDGIH